MENIFTQAAIVQATCEFGLAEYLATELRELGCEIKRVHRTGVEVMATMNECMRLCLSSRLAYSFLYQLADFSCRNADELYRFCTAYAWEEILSPTAEISLTCRVNNETITDTRFPVLKLKDAIVDRLREKYATRPNSNNEKRGVVIHLNWEKDQAWLFINAAGNKLSDRGYRRNAGTAPLRENLAAAILRAMNYDGTLTLINPMGGSGTLAIEAALIMKNFAPGLLRDNFSFKHLKPFDAPAYLQLRQQLTQQKKSANFAPIILSDQDEQAINNARKNAATAGVENLITFQVGDFTATKISGEKKLIVINPPYGERIGEIKDLEILYAQIGDWLKQHCQNSTGYVFTGNRELAKKIGLKPTRKFALMNGKIDCRLLQYDIW